MEYTDPLYVKILTTVFLGIITLIVLNSFFKMIKNYVVGDKLKK